MSKVLKAKKTTEQIITEIHSEFDSASERLLKEAKEIIINDNNKGDRLKRLGFDNSKPVKEIAEMREAQYRNQELAERVAYFGQWYPHNKFITEEAVQRICEKYGLVFADAQYYKGDVPEKNLLEMERFVLRKEDAAQDLIGNFAAYFHRRMRLNLDWSSGISGPRFTFDDSPDEEELPRPSFKICAPEKDFETGGLTKKGHKFCAPEKDFETGGLTKKGHKLELNIPDPIVLQPVKGGYLIVTKWGLEASDDMVKNDIAN